MAFRKEVLGSFIRIEKGLTYKGESLVEESETALIGMDSFIPGGGYKSGSEKPYNGSFKSQNTVEAGDLLLCATDVTQDGGVLSAPLLVPDELGGYECLVYSHHVGKVNVVKEGIRPEFIYNFFRIPINRIRCAYGDTGTTVRALPYEVVYEQEIPVPSLEEQDRINSLIATVDRKIQLNSALASTLEKIAQSVFRSWFIDFDPVRAKMAGEMPAGVDDATTSLFPDSLEDSELGPIPEGWCIGSMSDFFALQGGFSFKSSSWKPTGVPVVKIGSVKPGIVDLTQVSYVDDSLAAKTSDVYRLFRGSLVIGLTGYVGEVGLVVQHQPIPLLNQRVAKFLPVNGVWKIPFTYCLTRRPEFKKLVADAATGSAQQNVSNSQILGLKACVPPSELIERFNDRFESAFEQILSLTEQNIILGQLRDSLMPRLISGELRIPEEILES
jgi:type I restriction enzyme S subunit